ncbi:BlaI/MecI/CopY family transcriptional regulator [Thalassoroseus pseudoceratinae]|uniref:BlaI/MecI/CopY family transcriptional regulator n=1 Tax=Thalassoroseus pseudoceratinae TaxID=2713176 RepID=UPI001422CE53|nr:BlaI/MecI/CopY family transcriptional regulator [Thalassoroseus pseudoceratinae]
MPEDIEPGDVELKILQELWSQPGSTARDIHNAVHAQQGKNYSTTVKMLAVMQGKGLVRKDESVRPQTFFAAVTRKRAQKGLVTRLMQKAFDGSAISLAMQALTASRPSKEDLEEIRRLIDKLEEKQ